MPNSRDELNELLIMPTSDLKRDTYTLFHEVFEHTLPSDAKQNSPIDEIFNAVSSSFELVDESETALFETMKRWWDEWYFALSMDNSLSHEKEDVPYSFLSKKMHHPMKRHEMSHYAHLFTILPMPISNVVLKPVILLELISAL
ncbi:hypothetical protein P4S68_20080 [Pseudoalteromonas sp. Hal099]